MRGEAYGLPQKTLKWILDIKAPYFYKGTISKFKTGAHHMYTELSNKARLDFNNVHPHAHSSA